VQLFEMLSYLINFLAGAIEIYASQAKNRSIEKCC
jgi:hypothetical protein